MGVLLEVYIGIESSDKTLRVLRGFWVGVAQIVGTDRIYNLSHQCTKHRTGFWFYYNVSDLKCQKNDFFAHNSHSVSHFHFVCVKSE